MTDAECWGTPSEALDCLWSQNIKLNDAVTYLLNRLTTELVRARASLALVAAGEFLDRHENKPVPSGLWAIRPQIGINNSFWETTDVVFQRRGFDERLDREKGPVQLFGVAFDMNALRSCLGIDNTPSSGAVGALPGKATKPALSLADFDRWVNKMAKSGLIDKLSVEHLGALIAHDHPNNSIARKRIEALGTGRKRGPKSPE